MVSSAQRSLAGNQMPSSRRQFLNTATASLAFVGFSRYANAQTPAAAIRKGALSQRSRRLRRTEGGPQGLSSTCRKASPTRSSPRLAIPWTMAWSRRTRWTAWAASRWTTTGWPWSATTSSSPATWTSPPSGPVGPWLPRSTPGDL